MLLHNPIPLKRSKVGTYGIIGQVEGLSQFFHGATSTPQQGNDLTTSTARKTFISLALFDATEGYDGDVKLLKVFDAECR